MSEPQRFLVRLSSEAQQNIVQIVDAFDLWSGDAGRARELLETLRQAAGSLAVFPERYVVDAHVTRRLGIETRRLLVVHRYLLFFTVRPESEDGPTVWVTFIRPAAMRPLTTREARRIRRNQQ